jgi:hypothetical protein
MSDKRRAQLAEREEVRRIVLDRDRSCRAAGRAPGPCRQFRGRKPLEVHELWPGAGRSTSWLNPDDCIAVCPSHHDWITEHPADAERLGLLRRGWRSTT